jgi:hypothetical protein
MPSTDFIDTIALYPIGPEASSYTLILRAAHHRGSSPSVLILVVGIDLLTGSIIHRREIIDSRALQKIISLAL